jgi:hypothetical protein
LLCCPYWRSSFAACNALIKPSCLPNKRSQHDSSAGGLPAHTQFSNTIPRQAYTAADSSSRAHHQNLRTSNFNGKAKIHAGCPGMNTFLLCKTLAVWPGPAQGTSHTTYILLLGIHWPSHDLQLMPGVLAHSCSWLSQVRSIPQPVLYKARSFPSVFAQVVLSSWCVKDANATTRSRPRKPMKQTNKQGMSRWKPIRASYVIARYG